MLALVWLNGMIEKCVKGYGALRGLDLLFSRMQVASQNAQLS
jgi:hypothetical protein